MPLKRSDDDDDVGGVVYTTKKTTLPVWLIAYTYILLKNALNACYCVVFAAMYEHVVGIISSSSVVMMMM